MRSTDEQEQAATAMVSAARSGDRRALEQLVEAYLPLVYNIVGRALGGHADVDDVVQETMLRAVAGLPGLREPERFRSWLVAITVRQVRNRWHEWQARPYPGVPEDGAGDAAASEADFADLTILRLALSGQRREVVEATRWLDEGEREVLSLWWLEAAGELTRRELAEACELPPQHAAVRVQRVKQRLESARAVVRALTVSPRCGELLSLVTSWDGRPSALWRKRLARHVTDCPQCLVSASDLVPAEGLLAGLGLVPVPIALLELIPAASTGVSGGTAGGASGGSGHAPGSATGRATRLLSRLAVKPVAVVAVGAVAVAGGVSAAYIHTRPHSSAPVAAAGRAVPTPLQTLPTPVASATPTNEPAVARLSGPHALQSVEHPGRFVLQVGRLGFLDPVSVGSSTLTRQDATFTFVAGLADRSCYSLRDASGRYLRHFAFRVRLDVDDGSSIFRLDATFCPRPGAVDGSISLESYNYPGRYLRYRSDYQLWLDPAQNTDAYRASRSFRAVAAWA
ncbi:sigma-70 family RNA polymerase sigma factor [Streptacidiphilus sp. EB103A]|uniref:sigma-70 family RNA polymerase sigma factor n=1 Tax=Streptacidiphilus sp. EB103A TaxID=3156275 RepID=UPI0035145DD2